MPMSALHAARVQQLCWVQERLAAAGIRAILVSRVRLTLTQNTYQPPVSDDPVLAARHVTVSYSGDYLVELPGCQPVRFTSAEETASYVSSLITSASSGG
ncbi:hypothetical protein [Nonomuraea sediminis]|uniref:hypothetical protein n=1 Tax=Nonomuraea sediminis TaxID=2835864 RepID=UPI001BDC57FC|nr:hypothetical protein [Nonomuraea sediminis]